MFRKLLFIYCCLFILTYTLKKNSLCGKCAHFLGHIYAFTERLLNSLRALGTQRLQLVSVKESY